VRQRPADELHRPAVALLVEAERRQRLGPHELERRLGPGRSCPCAGAGRRPPSGCPVGRAMAGPQAASARGARERGRRQRPRLAPTPPHRPGRRSRRRRGTRRARGPSPRPPLTLSCGRPDLQLPDHSFAIAYIADNVKRDFRLHIVAADLLRTDHHFFRPRATLSTTHNVADVRKGPGLNRHRRALRGTCGRVPPLVSHTCVRLRHADADNLGRRVPGQTLPSSRVRYGPTA
jgi:hypothetical protein